MHVRGFPSQFVLQSKSTTFGAFVQRLRGILISCVIKFTCWSHQTALTKFNLMQSSQQKFEINACLFGICFYHLYTSFCIFLQSYPLTSPPMVVRSNQVARNHTKRCSFQAIHLGNRQPLNESFIFRGNTDFKTSKMTTLLWYVGIL